MSKILQENLWSLIDNLYQSGIIITHIEIVRLVDVNKITNISMYKIKYFKDDGSIYFNLKSSQDYGVWGIDAKITVEEIYRILKEEIRQSKIDHLLE